MISKEKDINGIFRQLTLESLKLIRRAKKASLIFKKDDGKYAFGFVYGYNARELKKLELNERNLLLLDEVEVVHNISIRDEEFLDSKIYEVLKRTGVLRVRSTLIIPIIVDGSCYANLNLDNLDEERFDDRDIKIGRMISVVASNIVNEHLHMKRLSNDFTIYREYVENDDKGLLIRKLSGEIIFANENVSKILSIPREALLNKNINDVITPFLRHVNDKMSSIIDMSNGQLFEWKYGDNPKKYLFITHWTTKLEDTFYVLSMLTDVSEMLRSKQMIQMLSEIENIFSRKDDLFAISDALLNTLTKYFEIDSGAFYVYDKNTLKLISSKGNDELPERILTSNEEKDIFSRTIRFKKVACLDSSSVNVDEQWLQGKNGAVVSLPILSGNSVKGVLLLFYNNVSRIASEVLDTLESAAREISYGFGSFMANLRLKNAYEDLLENVKDASRAFDILIPKIAPRMGWFRLHSRFFPLDMPQGDYHKIFAIDEENIGVITIDSGGEGVKGALIAIFVDRYVTNNLVDNISIFYDPLKFIEKLNKCIMHELKGAISKNLKICYLLLKTSEFEFSVAVKGMDWEYATIVDNKVNFTPLKPDILHIRKINPQESFLIYTDGLSESTELLYLLNLSLSIESKSLFSSLTSVIEEQVLKNLRDDITVILIEQAPPYEMRWVGNTLFANVFDNRLYIISNFARNFLDEIKTRQPSLNISKHYPVMIEMVTNAIEHGNLRLNIQKGSMEYAELYTKRLNDPRYSQKQVNVRAELKKNSVIYTVKDDGEGFDWHAFIARNPTPEELWGIQGRGIYIIREMSDEIHFNDKGNEITVMVSNE